MGSHWQKESLILLVTTCRHLHLAALNFWLLKKGSIKFQPTSGSDRRCRWLYWTCWGNRRDAAGCLPSVCKARSRARLLRHCTITRSEIWFELSDWGAIYPAHFDKKTHSEHQTLSCTCGEGFGHKTISLPAGEGLEMSMHAQRESHNSVRLYTWRHSM